MLKVYGIGRLTVDPETRNFGGGNSSVTVLRMAFNRRYKKDGEWVDDTVFMDANAWNGMGETLAKFAKKGTRLLVEGRVRQETWEDKTSGQQRSRHVLVLEGFQFLDSANKQENESSDERPKRGRPKKETVSNDENVNTNPGDENEEVPF